MIHLPRPSPPFTIAKINCTSYLCHGSLARLGWISLPLTDVHLECYSFQQQPWSIEGDISGCSNCLIALYVHCIQAYCTWSEQEVTMSSTFLFYLCSVFAVCALLPGTIRAEPKCHLQEVERCFDKLHSLKDANNDPSYLLTSTDGLDRICRYVLVASKTVFIAILMPCKNPQSDQSRLCWLHSWVYSKVRNTAE